MSTKPETKAETLNRLFRENGLTSEDVYKHSHYTIITRSGIEKIQYKNQITVEFDAITMTPELCVIKAKAQKPKSGDQWAFVQTFGSAGHNGNGQPQKGKDFQYLYYPEMAEKRALSRAVLKITNFYELGVFGEDESDDFKNKTGEVVLEPASAPKPEKAPAPAKQENAPQAAANEPQQANIKYATPQQKEEIINLLNDSVITRQEKTKMLLGINTLDDKKAAEAITKIKKVIEDRKDGQSNAA